jgi:thioredoxin 1
MHGDDSNFDAVVLQADVPVLVDFYADWCGPCQELAPVLDRVAEDLTEGRIVKVNVDQSPRITARYNIQTIPTMLVFVNGQVVDRAMGLKSEADLRRLLQR